MELLGRELLPAVFARVLTAGVLLAAAVMGTVVADANAAGRAGTLAPGFGSGGRVLTGFPAVPDEGRAGPMAVRPDGTVVLLGTSRRDSVLAGFEADGSPEAGFGDRGFVSGLFARDGKPIAGTALAVQADGAAVIGGATDIFRGGGVLVRVTREGRIDRSFGTGGIAETAVPVRFVEVDSAGRLVVAGTSAFDITVSRFTADGRPDPSFGDGGSVTRRFGGASGLSAISLEAGRITISGRGGLLRLMPDGQPDPGFGTSGATPTGATAMTVLPDRRIVIADEGLVRRLNADGTSDSGFGEDGARRVPTAVADLAVDRQGNILVGGTSLIVPHTRSDFEVRRLTPDGDPDASFGTGGAVRQSISGGVDSLEQLAVTAGGVLASGTSQPGGFGISRFSLARYTEDGQPDPAFGEGQGFVSVAPLMPSNDRAMDAARWRGRTVVVGKAGFRAGIAVYRAGGKPDRSFGTGGRLAERFSDSPYGDTAESVLPRPDGLLVCVSSSRGSDLVRYRPDGSRDAGFGENGVVPLPEFRHCDAVIADRKERLLVGGQDAERVVHLTRLHRNGRTDRSYGEDGRTTLSQIIHSGARWRPTSFVLARNGDMIVAGGRTGATLLRLKPDGAPRRSFGERGQLRFHGTPGLPFLGRVGAVEVSRSGRILIGGVSRKRLVVVALRPEGKAARKFGVRGVATVKRLESGRFEDLRSTADGGIIAAGTARGDCVAVIVCEQRTVVARFGPTGKPQRSFARKGVLMRKFGLSSTGTGVLADKRGFTVTGTATTRTGRGDFLVFRLRR
jgi:uncharacterized delta-60 repeat protein